MTFYRFAVTFRHHAQDIDYFLYQFANLIYRDKKFPRDDVHYETLKEYIKNQYISECEQSFEILWNKYKEAIDWHEKHD